MSRDLDTFLWKQNPIFAAAGGAACADLAARYPGRTYQPDEVMVEAGQGGDHLLVVLSGTVRIFHRNLDGREVVVKFLRAPNSFGDLAVLHDLPFMEYLASVDQARLARIPKLDFIDFLQRYPKAMYQELKHMSAAFCVASRNEKQIFAPIAQRVANLILSFADYYGEQVRETTDQSDPPRVTIHYNLSQHRIAQSLGVVQRSVARVLSQWRSEGVIARSQDTLIILKPDLLERLAAPIRGSICYSIGMPLDRLTQEPEKEQAQLEIVGGHKRFVGKRYAIGDQLIVGRQPPAGLLLPDDAVSPQHCRVFRAATGGRYWVEDLGSLNGTWIGNREVNRAVLRPDTEIMVGGTRLVFLSL